MAAILANKVAIVTGAGGAIGRAIAQLFVAEGARVMCLDIADLAAKEAAESADPELVRARARTCDVTDELDVSRAVGAVLEVYGTVDVLVNSAAAPVVRGSVDEMSREVWDRVLAVNLTGALLTSKYVVPTMRAAGHGVVIHIASQLGHVGIRGGAAYCASKAALIQLARVMALDHAADGIRVNSLSPGAILGERAISFFGSLELAEQALAPKHPIGRLGRPEEIAQAALFLADDRCSFMTGADLVVDGGYIAR